MKNAFKLEKLEAMSADELEQYRDRGREYRVMLNCAVLGQLAVPEGWQVVAEEGCEFCGRVPVVCRISPAGDEATALYLCSAGAEVPNWSMRSPRLVAVSAVFLLAAFPVRHRTAVPRRRAVRSTVASPRKG